MNVLVRFIPKGFSETKTLFNYFELKNVLTQYREPIDDGVVSLLAAKIAFENNAESVKIWIGSIPKPEEKRVDFQPIIKTISKRKRG